MPEQRLHQHARIDAAHLWFQHQPDVFGRFVAHIGQQRVLLELDDFGQLFDQARFLHLIRNFGDDDLPGAPSKVFDRPACAQPEGSATGAIGIEDVVARLDQNAPGRKVRAGHKVEKRRIGGIGMLDQMQTGFDQLAGIVRRYVGRHPHGNAAGPICQQVRKQRRQNFRFLLPAVIVWAEIDGILVQPRHHRDGNRRHPRLGIAHGSRVIAVDIAEVSLTVYQRIADREFLRQPRQRVIDRLVAMRMILAHHLTDDRRTFAETGFRIELHLVHGIQDASVHRLQPVARIGQRPVHDRGQGIGQIAFAQRPSQRLGDLARWSRYFGVFGRIGHRCGDTCPCQPGPAAFAAPCKGCPPRRYHRHGTTLDPHHRLFLGHRP